MNAQETSTSHASQNSKTVERLGRLAGAIAHDFNNLLLAVQGHAELITMLPGVKEGGDVQNRAMTIVEASKRGAGKLFIKNFQKKQFFEKKFFEKNVKIFIVCISIYK